MKELDVLLQPFVDKHQEELANGDWPEFESLLETEDDLLWDWFQDPGCAASSRYRRLLEQIRCDRA